MALGHEKLDVYRLAISYLVWVYESEEDCAEETERVDPDSDIDLDETKPRQGGGGEAWLKMARAAPAPYLGDWPDNQVGRGRRTRRIF